MRIFCIANLVFIVALFSSKQSFGNDSTLNKKRIEKIRELAEWLQAKSKDTLDEYQNGKSYYYRIYDTAINVFFANPQPNSRDYLRSSINMFNASLRFSSIDSFVLRTADPLKDTLLDPKVFSSYFKNTIILYFPMYGQEFEGMYFEFVSNSSQLIYLIDAGGTDEDYRKKKTFLNTLTK